MRNITACLLATALLLSLTACGQEPPKEPDTLGQALFQVFEKQYEADPNGSLDTMAQAVLAQESIDFDGTTSPVEPGPLMGFGNTPIEGFQEGIIFAPLISVIPFLGYLFRLDPGTDSAAFVKTLEESADLRWNICTQADEVVVKQVGDVVFFLMCPRSLDEGSQEEPLPEGDLLPEEEPLPSDTPAAPSVNP